MKARISDLSRISDERKLTFTTCYDYIFPQLFNRSTADGILISDSAALVVHGFTDTIPATVEMWGTHTFVGSVGTNCSYTTNVEARAVFENTFIPGEHVHDPLS